MIGAFPQGCHRGCHGHRRDAAGGGRHHGEQQMQPSPLARRLPRRRISRWPPPQPPLGHGSSQHGDHGGHGGHGGRTGDLGATAAMGDMAASVATASTATSAALATATCGAATPRTGWPWPLAVRAKMWARRGQRDREQCRSRRAWRDVRLLAGRALGGVSSVPQKPRRWAAAVTQVRGWRGRGLF